jgi:hypothetical protein
MNINHKILSIPPYISTSWKNIASLHLEPHSAGDVLIITLLSGAKIEVPHLAPQLIEPIFTAHAHYLELEEKMIQTKSSSKIPSIGEQFVIKLPLPSQIAELEGFPTLLHHNPEQANHPDLPHEVLEKISEITHSMGVEDPEALPKPEDNCNCMRCQIARSMQKGAGTIQEEPEEIVSDADLTFKTWDVCQKEDRVYLVTNPLETKEQYQVHLGDPVGCTCGHTRCEHIHAVLKS